jgi:hypothetical protein
MSLEKDFTAAGANMDNIHKKLSEDEQMQVLCTRLYYAVLSTL